MVLYAGFGCWGAWVMLTKAIFTTVCCVISITTSRRFVSIYVLGALLGILCGCVHIYSAAFDMVVFVIA